MNYGFFWLVARSWRANWPTGPLPLVSNTRRENFPNSFIFCEPDGKLWWAWEIPVDNHCSEILHLIYNTKSNHSRFTLFLLIADIKWQKNAKKNIFFSLVSVLVSYKTILWCPTPNCYPIICFAKRVETPKLLILFCPLLGGSRLLHFTALIRGNTFDLAKVTFSLSQGIYPSSPLSHT